MVLLESIGFDGVEIFAAVNLYGSPKFARRHLSSCGAGVLAAPPQPVR